jgi:hypothetical protein
MNAVSAVNAVSAANVGTTTALSAERIAPFPAFAFVPARSRALVWVLATTPRLLDPRSHFLSA